MSDTEHVVSAAVDTMGVEPWVTLAVECMGDPDDDSRSCRMVDIECIEHEQEEPCPVHGGTVDRCPAVAVSGEVCAARHYLDAVGIEGFRFAGGLYPIETPFRARVWWDDDDVLTLEPLPEETP